MSMEYQFLLTIAENEKTLAAKDVLTVISSLTANSDEDNAMVSEYEKSVKKKLRDIANLIGDESICIQADSDDYHNMSVGFARQNMYDCSIVSLKRGLKQAPYSVDLLADMILYGLEGSQRDQSEKAYKILIKMGKSRWNWRAYAFTIDYYLDKATLLPEGKKLETLRTTALQLAEEFIAYSENNIDCMDKAYFNKAKVARKLGGSLTEEKILLEGYKRVVESQLCALRLSEIFSKKKKYNEALEYLFQCKVAINEEQPDIKPEYVYLRSAMTKTSKVMSETVDGNFSEKEDEINSIYKDFHTVLNSSDLTPLFKKTSHEIIKVLETQSGVKDAIEEKESSEFV